MAGIDAVAQRIFMDYIQWIIIVLLLIFLLIRVYPHIVKMLVCQQILQSERCYAIRTRYYRQKWLAPLHGLISADLFLRNKGIIRILDIGVTTGINIRYYPNSAHVIAVDKKPNLENFFLPNIGMFDHVSIVECIEFDGNTLRNIPDNFADAVVGSFVLCKATHEASLLQEIYRILAPGGHYYFIEHTVEEADRSLRRWQKLLSVSKIWPKYFLGCHLNRDLRKVILDGPFTVVHYDIKNFYFSNPLLLKFVKSHIMGYAVKENFM